MCIMQVEDSESSTDVVIFPDKWKTLKETLKSGQACIIEGRLDDRGQVLLEKIILSENLEESGQKYINIVMDITGHNNLPDMKKFVAILSDCKGGKNASRVILEVKDEYESCVICLRNPEVDPVKLQQKLQEELPAEFARMFDSAFSAV